MELTPTEIKRILKYIIDNNRVLQDKGKDPIAVNIEGLAGISKTAVVEQIAKEREYNYIKLCLSQCTDTGDLIGFPVKEFQIYKQEGGITEYKWVASEVLRLFLDKGWELTGDSRLGYTLPAWLKCIDPNKPTILNYDDFGRCPQALTTASMEIIYKQEYISWKLPKYTTVICTSNPNDGTYDVTEVDDAVKTRMLTFKMKFDIKSWQKWAENEGIDSRCINFLSLYHTELMLSTKGTTPKINARNYTMFSNIISGIPDWSSTKALTFILQVASGCFSDNDIIGGLFTQFISNKLDKLLSPEDIINGAWSNVRISLENQIYDNDKYRADIASIFTTRLINYIVANFKSLDSKFNSVIDRIVEIIDNDKVLLTEDLVFTLIKSLNKNFPSKCNKLLLNPKIVNKLI